jgi:hypothetical protein
MKFYNWANPQQYLIRVMQYSCYVFNNIMINISALEAVKVFSYDLNHVDNFKTSIMIQLGSCVTYET